MRVRYEDVVRRPAEQVRRAAAFVGVDIDVEIDVNRFREDAFELGVNHTVAGNRVRLHQGAVPVRLDDEWTRAMPGRHQRLVTLLSWPLLRAYGYVGARRVPATGGL
jgi:hypothetical protein